MKFSTALSVALVLLPAIQEASAALVPRQNRGAQRGGFGQNRAAQGGQNKGQNGGQNNGQNGKGGQAGGNNGANNGQNNANNGTAAGGQNNGGNGQNNNNNDPQTSLTLDPKVIAPGFAQDGQNPPVAGQIASATSTNNFINFCLTVPNLPLTNGQQVQGGSCNPAPMGVIPSVDNMPSCKFVFPKNTQTIPSDQQFTFQLAIQHLSTGHFTNAQANYFSAPQTIDGSGDIVGHSHITCDALTSIDQTTPNNPREFAFFKGLNDAAQNGILTASVDKGLPAGVYRCCTINSSANHTPALAPVAQHGPLDDCIYFTTSPGGAAAGNGAANNGTNTGANNGANTGANNGANTGANNGANNGANTGANNGTNTGANNGANTGANNGANTGANNGANTGANNGANTGANNGANNGGKGANNAGGAAAGGAKGANNGQNGKGNQNAQNGQNRAANGGAGRQGRNRRQ